MPQTEKPRDYFAEQFIAGVFADAGWNIYFPRRDVGFDFIITKQINQDVVMRPIQVKGKFPEGNKKDRGDYGFIGQLSALHPDMVLVIPYFTNPINSPADAIGVAPVCIAFIPRQEIRPQVSKGFACRPARIEAGIPKPRRDFTKYFDKEGLLAVEVKDWGKPEQGAV